MPEASNCALCLSSALLEMSHGIPAGVYRLLGPASENGPISYAGTDGWKPLTKQDRRPLLCRNCEITLAKAEDWVLRRAPRRGKFPLLDVLLSHSPDYRWPMVDVYATVNRPAVDVDRLCQFATSIFWRYSVALWPSGHSIRLGPYSEELRQYLCGGTFPKTARLMCFLSRFTAANSVIMMPSTVQAEGFLLHQFVIPGFDFMLVIGRNAPASFDPFCLMHGPERPIVVSQRSDSRRLVQLLRTMNEADAFRAATIAKKTRR
jgi:hypothetical protein